MFHIVLVQGCRNVHHRLGELITERCTLSRPFASSDSTSGEEAEISIRRQYEVTRAPDSDALEDIVARSSWASPIGPQKSDLIVAAENLNYYYKNEVLHVSGEVNLG